MDKFKEGFIKRANAFGLNTYTAERLFKAADEEAQPKPYGSSPHGRYFDLKKNRMQTMIDHPFKASAGGLGGRVAGSAIGALIGGLGGAGIGATTGKGQHIFEAATGGAGLGGYLGGMIGAPMGNSLGSQGLTEEQRNKTLSETDKGLSERSTAGNVLHSGKNMGLLGGTVGGLYGAGIGLANPHGVFGDNIAPWQRALIGGGIGAVGGGASAGLAGGALGGINKFIHNYTSDETHNRSRNMLARHPMATTLPFGDVVGAMDS
jgi:hypothetical protein